MNILNFGGSITLVCGTLMAFAGGPANAAPVEEYRPCPWRVR